MSVNGLEVFLIMTSFVRVSVRPLMSFEFSVLSLEVVE